MAHIRREEGGFLLVEVVVAVTVLAIGLLALMAVYDAAIVSLRSAGKHTAASQLATDQLELYDSLAVASVGLDSAALTTAKASDPYYATDETGLAGATGTDVTISGCGSAAHCAPVQVLTGSDRLSYRVETFIRDVTLSGQTERIISVVVRSASSGSKVLTFTSARDAGPR